MDLYLPAVVMAVGICLVLVIVLIYLVMRRISVLEQQTRENPAMMLLQQQLESIRGQFNESLDRNIGLVTRSLDDRLKVVGAVQTKLGALEEASRRIMEIGRDIAGLQNILRSPKIRGGVGEFILENLLSQMLPHEHYRLQHTFKKGDKVDAVVLLGGRIVPVDAKFPLENFRRMVTAEVEDDRKAARKVFLADVKRHVDNIASKYILPDEETYDFALMYIPAENVYYETIIKAEEGGSLMDYSLSRKVIPVSPNSFYAYLQVIIIGLRGMHVEESAREIIARISGLRQGMEKYRDDFRKLGLHLKNASGAYDSAEKKLERISLKIEELESPESNALPGG